MKNVVALFGAMLLLQFPLQAQNLINAEKLSNQNYPSLEETFRDYALYHIPTSSFVSIIAAQPSTDASLSLQLPETGVWNLRLHNIPLRGENYAVHIADESGIRTMPGATAFTLGGYLAGDEGSRVSLTVSNGVLYGIIKTGGTEYFLEPLHYLLPGSDQDVMILYRVEDVLPNPALRCGVRETAVRQSNTTISSAGINCVQVETAIASDASMFDKYGSVSAVEVHNLGVMNNVLWDYVNNQFNNNIEFTISGQYVSTNTAADPLSPAYTGTHASTILSNFRTWGNAGNFGFNYDIAQFWTDRNIDDDGMGGSSGIIGLAYVGVVCNFSRYHILEDFAGTIPNGSGYALRVLTSHEIGHNFNASHDAPGSGYIMAPSVNNTTVWSPVSIASVDAHVNTRVCLANCDVEGAPDADFVLFPDGACININLQFTDRTLNGPTSWAWSFPDGSPANSALRNPVVSYATPGLKSVALNVENAVGSDVVLKSVLISDAPATACVNASVNTSNAGLHQFTLNNINFNSSGVAGDGGTYIDRSCEVVTRLLPGTTYAGSARLGTNNPSNQFNRVQVWIDYNNDGDFNDTDELVYSSGSCYIGTHNFSFTTPDIPPVNNHFLRLRVMAKDCFAGTNPCYTVTNGQVEDFSVFFADEGVVPVQLTTFSGHQNGPANQLYWTSAMELNFSHYELQRSFDGNTFSNIAVINGAGVESGSNYEYRDEIYALTAQREFFYRLKMVDRDGSFTYSNIVHLQTQPATQFSLYPNPVSRGGVLNFHSPQPVRSVTWKDVQGRTVYEMNIQNGTSIIVPDLAPGVYLLYWKGEAELPASRVVITP